MKQDSGAGWRAEGAEGWPLGSLGRGQPAELLVPLPVCPHLSVTEEEGKEEGLPCVILLRGSSYTLLCLAALNLPFPQALLFALLKPDLCWDCPVGIKLCPEGGGGIRFYPLGPPGPGLPHSAVRVSVCDKCPLSVFILDHVDGSRGRLC